MSTATLAWLQQHAPDGDLPKALTRWWPATQSLEDRIWVLAEFMRPQFVAKLLRDQFRSIMYLDDFCWFSDFERWSGALEEIPKVHGVQSSGTILILSFVSMLHGSDPRAFARDIAGGLVMVETIRSPSAGPYSISPAISNRLERLITPSSLVSEIKPQWTHSPS